MYLAVDGGGSKIKALVFDAQLHKIGQGRSGGVNATQNDPESILAHVRACLDEALAGIRHIDEAFVTFVGDRTLFAQELQARVSVGELHFLDEARAGLLAGVGRSDGLLAISGTGSDVFYLSPDSRNIVGGWGIVLGDQGSGTWIGLQAVRSVIRALDGWGPETLLTPLVLKHFHAEDEPRQIIGAVYQAPAPFPVIAALTPLVGEAARQGDPEALRIFTEAGVALGRQMLSLLQRLDEVPDVPITLCGGAWKAHPQMLKSFSQTVQVVHPHMVIARPWFEHVLAGPMAYLLRNGKTPEEARCLLAQAFPEEVIS